MWSAKVAISDTSAGDKSQKRGDKSRQPPRVPFATVIVKIIRRDFVLSASLNRELRTSGCRLGAIKLKASCIIDDILYSRRPKSIQIIRLPGMGVI